SDVVRYLYGHAHYLSFYKLMLGRRSYCDMTCWRTRRRERRLKHSPQESLREPLGRDQWDQHQRTHEANLHGVRERKRGPAPVARFCGRVNQVGEEAGQIEQKRDP